MGNDFSDDVTVFNLKVVLATCRHFQGVFWDVSDNVIEFGCDKAFVVVLCTLEVHTIPAKQFRRVLTGIEELGILAKGRNL